MRLASNGLLGAIIYPPADRSLSYIVCSAGVRPAKSQYSINCDGGGENYDGFAGFAYRFVASHGDTHVEAQLGIPKWQVRGRGHPYTELRDS